ncbi:MAG: DUF4832 domain-containing protein [Agriterribacter sp.]
MKNIKLLHSSSLIALSIMILSIFSFSKCNKATATGGDNKANTVTYTESGDDFPNPERGFYRYSEAHIDNYEPLDVDLLREWRTLQQADGGTYKVYSTLVFRYFVMDGYTAESLPASFLENIKKDCAIAREAGVKLIARFTYTVTANAGNCAASFICPPYGDASPAIVAGHIAQLKPVFQQNNDVIACYQAGFIGVWGEQYYSDYFGDPSQNGAGKLVDNNWQDRINFIAAMLDAVPKDRMIQVRMPQTKQRFVYGIHAPVTSLAMQDAEAFTETDKARIGFHNDCFLSGPDDYGTYDDLGNSSTPRQSLTGPMRAYMQQESKYVVVGGETCSDAYSPQSNCETSGIAQTEMQTMHYSFLNCAYNNALNNKWEEQGCMNNIKKNLGYRFVLKDGSFPSAATTGGNYSFMLNIENVGYASPFNERPTQLILRNGQQVYTIAIDTDVRKWYAGKIKLQAVVQLPAGIAKGTYELLLCMPDKYTGISKRPEYAVRLANENVWEESTGYNKLLASVKIQ